MTQAGLPIAVLYWLSAVASLVLAFRALAFRAGERSTAVARVLFWLAVATAEWAIASGFEVLSPTVEGRVLWSQIAYLGTYAAPTLLFALTVQWLWPDRAGRWLDAVWVIPIAMVVIAFTNARHGLIWTDVYPSVGHPALWVYEHGQFFWLGIGYIYLLISFSIFAFLRAVRRRRGVYRTQAIWMFAGSTVPVLCNLVYIASVIPDFPLEPTPICFAVSVGCYLIGIRRGRFFERLPLARWQLVDMMPDGWLVLDTELRVVDWNPRFLSLWRLDRTDIMGRKVQEIVPEWNNVVPADLESAAEASEGSGPVNISATFLPDESMRVDVLLRRFSAGFGKAEGWVTLFRDSSYQMRTEKQLVEANEQLTTLNRLLKEQAIHDALTGFYNRHYLDEALERELQRAGRTGESLCLLMCDIDNFKQVNDTYGHARGDEVIRRVSQAITSVIRGGDVPCRYGGDEFLIVLPHAGPAASSGIAKRIQDRTVRACSSAISETVTLSFGVSVFPEHGDTANALFRAADDALYRSKTTGRNCITIAPGGSE